MIELNTNLSYLTRNYEIMTQRSNQAVNKNIQETMDAGYGATSTQKLSSPQDIARAFKLSDAVSRYHILQNLSYMELVQLLQYLEPEDLIWGLKYFGNDKILKLMEELPQEELLGVVLSTFTPEEIILLMNDDELNEFLGNAKVERQDIMKFFASLKPDDFKALMAQIFPPEQLQQNSREDILGFFAGLDDSDFQKTIESFDTFGKQFMTWGVISEKPELMMELNPKTLTNVFRNGEQDEILKSLKNLDTKYLAKMVERLPAELLQVVVTQINPQVFAQLLSSNFADILDRMS